MSVTFPHASFFCSPARFGITSTAGILLFCLMTGCMKVGPDFVPPEPVMPREWLATPNAEKFNGNRPLLDWWTVFGDPDLTALIQRAEKQSPDIETALLRVAQARAQYIVIAGQLFPQQQALTGGYTWTHPSNRAPDAPQPGEPSEPDSILELNTGLQLSWELDFWGKYRRATEAARAELMAAYAARDLALVTLTADVARQYFLYRTLEEELRIAEKNNAAQLESVRLTGVRFRLGATSERDYDQAVAQQKSTEAAIPQLRQQLVNTQNALCVLLGAPPGTLPELGRPRPLPPLPETMAIGIPADLLRRRPDVRQAELAAAAQCARIGVSKAALFPAFSLGGFVGFQGSNVGAFSLGDTFDHGFTANGGPSVVFPLFNYGRLMNAVRVQDALLQQALTQYRQVVLAALEETENARIGLVRNLERLKLLEQAREAAERSVKLTRDQYTAGSTDFTSVVSAQSTLYTQENAVAVTRGAAVQQTVALFRALGGGWQNRSLALTPESIRSMRRRTSWGPLLEGMEQTLPPASPDTEVVSPQPSFPSSTLSVPNVVPDLSIPPRFRR